MIRISDVRLGSDVEDSVLRVLRSGRLSQGPVVAALEEEFARLAGTRHAVAVNNGTTALIAALRGIGIGPGDEVVVPDFTFVATSNAVLATGADVRLVDVRADDFCVDPEAVAAAMGPRTAAVMPVHLFGQPADLDALLPVVRDRVPIVEDAAQAHGAIWRGWPVGSLGRAGCFSFYATKNLVAGEGGIVTTDDADLADHLRVLRNQGMRERYEYDVVGENYRMTDLVAAVLLPQLARYDEQVARRREHASRLTAGLHGLPGLVLPAATPGREHVWHQYTVRLVGDIDRDTVAKRLGEVGVGSGVYYPRPLHEYACYREHPRVRADPTPGASEAAATCLSLPVHAGLTTDDVDRVVAALTSIIGAG